MHNISPEDAHEMTKDGEACVIDVRTPSEFSDGHIPNAFNIDIYDIAFGEKIRALDRNARYIINCQSGGRSAKATAFMHELGFANAKNLDGGIMAWKRLGFSTE